MQRQTDHSIVEAYSRCATEYDGEDNAASCWGILSRSLWSEIDVNPKHRLVVDVGCGSGATLGHLAKLFPHSTQLVGIEPAENMRTLSRLLTDSNPNVTVCDGSFEALPLQSGSVDYLYSIMAFHWVGDELVAAREIDRVLRHDGSADIFFVGRWNGREIIEKTTPTFLRYMGLSQLIAAARLRKQLTLLEATELFERAMPKRHIRLVESYKTYYDTLDGHWRWWVRIEGQLGKIPEDRRPQCEADVRAALQQMETAQGIPYTVHVLHVKITRKKTASRHRGSGSREAPRKQNGDL